MNQLGKRPWLEEISRMVDQHAEHVREIRRFLHQHPEPSGEEFHTTAFFLEKLKELDVQAVVGPGNRGLIIDAPGQKPVIAIRGDIDGLRIQDQKTTSYCSQADGLMHACGHDAHAAIAYGTMLTLMSLAKQFPEWSVPWRVLLQPAEETNRGAIELVEAGAVDGIQALMSLHMDPSRETGTIGVRSGAFTADCHELEVQVLGRGAHAARPHEACDPIAAAAQLISSIFLFIPRGTDSQDPVVVSFGQIQAGQNPNVIPDKVIVRGTLRTLDLRISENTIRHLERLARGVAEASGTTITVTHRHGPPGVENHPELTGIVREVSSELLGRESVQEISRPSMGGEDFANYLQKVPGVMFRLGCSKDPQNAPPLHSPLFDIDEEALVVGTKVLAGSVVEWYLRHTNCV
ncbi:amidohydrolase [Thalassoglobus sp. JC818]|uniref:M20 metallopeptidase family protein n=1 Tax=Thalassoglobus sp. JC818 TaxID=3232136 RepID=UPI003459BB67